MKTLSTLESKVLLGPTLEQYCPFILLKKIIEIIKDETRVI